MYVGRTFSRLLSDCCHSLDEILYWMPAPHRLLRSRVKLSQRCDPEAGSVHPAKWQGGAFRTALYDSLRNSQHREGDRSRHQVVQSIRCFCHAGTFCQVLEPWDPLCTDPVQDHRCLELLLQRQDSCSSWLEQRSSGRSRRSSKHDDYCRVERFAQHEAIRKAVCNISVHTKQSSRQTS